MFADQVVLNQAESAPTLPTGQLTSRLESTMAALRGKFFERGRVDYLSMGEANAYEQYISLSHSLKDMDLAQLTSREGQLAFWINLYNAIVIHGTIEFGIQDTIKEVKNFLKRIFYNVGGMEFSPDDMEHGVLRGNSRPPGAFLFKRFKGGDKRLQYCIENLEPRIHFALVRASASSPAFNAYTTKDIDGELDIAARTFINSGGAVVNKDKKRVSLSRIFKWYAPDFGVDHNERLHFIASYIEDEEDRVFLQQHTDHIKVDYQDYDWRLNKY